MKRFSQFNKDINEACVTSDANPGNSLNTGVMNHYTPIENILVNVRNIYGSRLSVVASVAEDGFSLKLNSSKFNTKESLNDTLFKMPDRTTISLNDYICQQGLTKVTTVDLGGAKVIYYSPADIKAAEPGKEAKTADKPVKEMKEWGIEEAELIDILNEDYDFVFESDDDDDEEIESIVQKELAALVDEKDKMKAARKFGEIIAQQVDLPQEYYFAGVTDSDGKQSIALRWRYLKRRPNGKSIERKRSLINIYKNSKDGVWVQDFDEKSMFKLPEDVEKLIKNILSAMGAEETSDKCVWDLSGNKEKSHDKDSGEKKKEDDDEDFEDDDSRGDNSDNDDNKDKDNMMGL